MNPKYFATEQFAMGKCILLVAQLELVSWTPLAASNRPPSSLPPPDLRHGSEARPLLSVYK